MSMVFADGTDNAKILNDFQQTIAKVRTMSGPSVTRTNAAEYLSRLTKEINPKKVDDKTIRDLVSLLDIPDDSVRLWVAAALGNLGPRAKMAVPALLRVVRETDCPPKIETGVTLSATALIALKRIGVEPPPPRDCGKKSD
jgi:hypothetical protein